jgi:hypothetical protein
MVVSGDIRLPVTHAVLLSASTSSAKTALAPAAGTEISGPLKDSVGKKLSRRLGQAEGRSR